MKKETQLNMVKAIAKNMLRVDIVPTDFSPVVVQHPFTNSGLTAIRKKDGATAITNLLTDKEGLAEWRKTISGLIDQSESAYDIYLLINKPYAMTFLKFSMPFLARDEFSRILSQAWIISENPNHDENLSKEQLVDMFKQAEKKVLMSKEELIRFKALEDPTTIYRGVTTYNADNIKALSWTTDFETADWFANRFGENGTVYEAKIAKKDILAFFDGRGESEVIVDPRGLMEIEEAQVPGMGPTMAY